MGGRVVGREGKSGEGREGKWGRVVGRVSGGGWVVGREGKWGRVGGREGG